MAAIDFYIPGADLSLNGSGLGFYGNGFGVSVNVGEYQNTTFITNSNGTAQGAQGNNIKYQNTASGIINSATSGVWLQQIPNYLSTLNVRFTHSSAVKTQNAKCYIYDRVSINNDPSGVLSKAVEIVHPSISQTELGSGGAVWQTVNGSASILSLYPSPGISGLYAAGGTSILQSTRHDSFLALSCSPSSVGSKLFALYVTLEYL